MPRTKQFDQQEVLHKAMELFWKKGYHATSMADLVEHLGINRASMYSTFKGGKDQIFQEAFQLYQKESGGYMQNFQSLLKNQSVRQFLERYFEMDLHKIENDQDAKGCMMVNMTTELANQSEAVREVTQQHMEQSIELLAKIMKIGQERNEISKQYPAQTIARKLFTFQCGLKVIAKIEQDTNKLAALIQSTLDDLFLTEPQ